MMRFVGATALVLLLVGLAYPFAHGLAADTTNTAANAKEGTAPVAKKSPITGKPPLDVVAAAPKGTLHNPYTDNPQMIQAGQKAFFGYGCNGCHGGGGGGGICPPLGDGVWIYGSDDDTLFRLVTLGSDKLQAAGYYRQAVENVVAPMPSFGPLIKSDDELWKIIAFVRSVYKGDPKRRNW
jgi:hypothetical protein